MSDSQLSLFRSEFSANLKHLAEDAKYASGSVDWWLSDESFPDRLRVPQMLAVIYANLSAIAPTSPWIADVSPEWAAGFFDGEGHVGITKHIKKNGRPQYMSRVQIGNTDRSLLEPFSVFGGLLTTHDSRRWNKNSATCYKWTIHARQAQNFILALMPYLKGGRKAGVAKCCLAMEFLRNRSHGNSVDNDRVLIQESLYQSARSMNQRGVDYDASDFRFKSEGIASEYADVIIRILDTCEQYHIPLVEAIRQKMEYNRTRPHRHGGKIC